MAGAPQERNPRNPNFSGEYVLDRQASTLSPGGAHRITAGRLQIDHREPHFRCHFTYDSDENHFEGAFELTTDGRESHDCQEGRSAAVSLRWDDGALVFTERRNGTLTFRYELMDDALLRVTEQSRGMGRDRDNIFVFRRSTC